MNKYIIKNCPALYQIEGMTNECLGNDYQCEDCTNCLLKQIYEKCIENIKEANNISLYKSEYGDIVYFEQQGMKKLSEHILDIYDIQEI